MIINAKVKEPIEKLCNDFRSTPAKYLTEDDVRCRLVSNLLEYEEFNKVEKSNDGIYSSPVHTEVRWYGNGKLKFRSDIVIIDVSSLKAAKSTLKIPSKGYSFNWPKAIIEIKLRRINGKSDKKFKEEVENEIKRIRKIKKELERVCFCALVILDRKNTIEVPASAEGIELFYEGTAEEVSRT